MNHPVCFQPLPPRRAAVDFFRGLALLVIFIDHMPSNPWSLGTPSRFGPSDAAELFVFLSGYCTGLAYVPTFHQCGPMIGVFRLLNRCAQIYAAHLMCLFLVATLCVAGNRLFVSGDYAEQMHLEYFFERTQDAMIDIFTLRYVPNLLDILPLYVVILFWIPLVWWISRLHRVAPLLVSLALYLASRIGGWELSADPITGRSWYFNPFNWQLMFLVGLSFGAGWIGTPQVRRRNILMAAGLVFLGVALGPEPNLRPFDWMKAIFDGLFPELDKTHLGVIRCIHFLALAFLGYTAAWRYPAWFSRSLPRWVGRVGRCALPMFILGLGLSIVGGMLLDWSGRALLPVAVTNLAGVAVILLAARGVEWIRSKPWRFSPEDSDISRQSFPRSPVARGSAIHTNWRAVAIRLPMAALLAFAPVCFVLSVRSGGVQLSAVESNVGANGSVSEPKSDEPEAEEVVEWQDGV